MNNEDDMGLEPNLKIFFGRFLNTPEEMDDYLGFRSVHERALWLGWHKPKIAVHVGVGCQAHYEKASEKDPQVLVVKRVE